MSYKMTNIDSASMGCTNVGSYLSGTVTDT